MKQIAQFLSLPLFAELLALAACVLGTIGLARPMVALAAFLVAVLAFVPVAVYGRERYCITGLFIVLLVLATVTLVVISCVRLLLIARAAGA